MERQILIIFLNRGNNCFKLNVESVFCLGLRVSKKYLQNEYQSLK